MGAPSAAPFRAPPGLDPAADAAARASAARAAVANLEMKLAQLGLRAPEDSANEFTVVLDKTTGRKLGANVNRQDGVTLEIEAVIGELFQQWNENHPELTVRRGDRIVEANGIRNDADQMLEQCSQNAILGLVIKRGQISELIEEIEAVIEMRVDVRTDELKAWGSKAMGQMNRKMKEKTATLSEEVALCREKQAKLETENQQLKKVLLFMAGQIQMLGTLSSSTMMASPRVSAAASVAAEPAARAAAVADPSTGPQAGVAKVASPQEGASSPLPLSTPPRRMAASPQEEVPKMADIPPFPFPGAASGTAPVPKMADIPPFSFLGPASGMSPIPEMAEIPPFPFPGPAFPMTTSRSPAAAPGPGAARTASGQFTFTLRRADGTDLGLEFSHADEEKVLRIERVRPESAVASWNRLCCGSADADKVVGEGDELVRVNNVWYDPGRMLQECEGTQLVKLTIVRGERVLKTMRAGAAIFVPEGAEPPRSQESDGNGAAEKGEGKAESTRASPLQASPEAMKPEAVTVRI